MENRRWIQGSWQASLLCFFVCLAHPALAKPTPSPATKKHNPPTTTDAKLKSKSKAISTLPLSHSTATHSTPSLQPRQQEQSRKQRISQSTTAQKTSPHSAERKSVKNTTRPETKESLSTTTQDRSKSRSITVLKETKGHTLLRTTVTIPVARTESHNQPRIGEEKSSRRQSPASLPTHKAHVDATKPQERRIDVSRSESLSVVKTSPTLSKESISAHQISPTPAVAPVVPPVLLTTPLQVPILPQEESPIPSTTPAPVVNAAQSRPVDPPTMLAKASTITFVEHGPTNPPKRDEGQAKESSDYAPQRAPFRVTLNDEELGYRTNSIFVLPGDEMFLEISDSQKKAAYTIHSTLGSERLLAARRWYWTAPATSGIYPVKIINTRMRSTIALNVFVMVPRDQVQDGYLNGYRVGQYPTEALRQLPMYTPPRGLIEITLENENTLVSPHFRLRQFLCKQDGTYPKYMILDSRLLTTLEQLLEMANANGYRARTFSIMSGYRTPYYNRAIGNHTTYSRHLWGDAADILIDEEPRDGKMDDLNQDGVIDAHDADVIYQLIENASEPRLQKIMMGGLARYRETSSHGPFIHVDARGSYARWGIKTLTRGGTTPGDAGFQTKEPPLSQPSFLESQSPTDPTP